MKVPDMGNAILGIKNSPDRINRRYNMTGEKRSVCLNL